MVQNIGWVFLSVSTVAFLACALLVLTQRWHGRLSLDRDLEGAQKFHKVPVPRVGGLGVALGLGAGVLVGVMIHSRTHPTAFSLLISALPVFAAGIIEDLTKNVSARRRLVASFVSAGLAAYALDAELVRIDVPLADDLISLTPVGFLFTCFAVAGMTNAVNIIDGFNGLASGTVALMLGGLAGIALHLDDIVLMKLCLWGVAALIGFMLLNFPFGKIFMGDGGAYLAGFWVAECAILLLARHPGLSTWAVLLCVLYPVWETLFSIWRKSIHRKTGAGRPDRVHFHMLVYRRMVSLKLGRSAPQWRKHAMTSALIWSLPATCSVVANIAARCADATLISISSLAIFGWVYGFWYRKMTLHPSGIDATSSISNRQRTVS
ncbi:glycosyl transferase 4 family protein [Aquabacterium olei]|uniref:Glycosyl transferase 4 family protein n=1 Tax=Aquabacterium olei TaxID=1296669 RepID=A0A2U8FTK4_9BURK|nr:glycosyltransferase [Aquabacterium olei]AWI54383.1 glycosyl transferase 4 family protein [Aquabacterium olei]